MYIAQEDMMSSAGTGKMAVIPTSSSELKEAGQPKMNKDQQHGQHKPLQARV